MDERCLQLSLQGTPKNAGPVVTAGPVPLTIPQCCTHRPGVKRVQANACPCWAANCPCRSGCPLENCRNRGSTLSPTAPRFTTNAIQNIDEAQEAAPTLCQTTPLVVFQPDAPAFSPSVLMRGAECSSLPARSKTDHTTPALTETANPNLATLASVGSGKINPNRAQPTDGQSASPSPPTDPDSDVTSAASFGGSDSNSDYVESAEN